ncbi:MAG: ABC transporter ATP-binding protein [Thermoplasmata archaeon]|nr:ABC transporter ATP-binding protein [Thermoplasmata archaeon]
MTSGEPGARGPPRGPMWSRQVTKPRSLSGAMKSLFAYMGRERRAVLAGMVLMLFATVLALIGPQFLEVMTDGISAAISGRTDLDMAWIGGIALTLLAIYLLSFGLNTASNYIISSSSERVGDRMRRDLSRKFFRLPFSYLESHQVGDLMSRMTNDTDTVRKSSGDSFATTFNVAFTIIGTLVMMFYTSWMLAIVAVIPTLVGMGVLYIVTHRTQKYFVAQQRDLAGINGIVEEVYYGHDIVRTYNGWDNSSREFGEINQRLFQSSFRARLATSMMPQLMNFIGNLGYVIVCIAGSILIMDGTIEYGVIAAFIVYIKMFTMPVAEMADVIARMQSVASASERVFDFLSLPEMDEDPELPGFGRAVGRVEFRGVRFGYVEGTEIIHGLDLTVEPGSTVAIVGPTGAGKTTIVNLLMRFHDPWSGSILIDGVPTSSMSRAQVRDQFSMVLQDSWIFEGTVHDNVAFTSAGATRESVEEACRTVGIDEYVRSLPDGYDTVLSPGSGLSVGQRQQIAIARAIVKDAPMIILDEATSSVDTRTEKRIQAAMDRMTAGRTSFVIAHRLSTVRHADRILVMVGGEIVESGTHEELLELGGYYRMLHDAQFEESDRGPLRSSRCRPAPYRSSRRSTRTGGPRTRCPRRRSRRRSSGRR